jgi:glutamyl-tRNA synthetase
MAKSPPMAKTMAPATGGVRFAPSPTGRFHIGNLRTAWISYQFARELKLPWVVRFEDIDRPRVLEGAQEQQLADMAELGLEADHVLLQSQFAIRHWQLLIRGIKGGHIYACDCSRKEVQTALAGIASAPHGGDDPVYSGACRRRKHSLLQAQDSIAWRFRMPHDSGRDDFIVARSSAELDKNGFPGILTTTPAYHWACAIDDYDGAYNLLVRSSDLKSAALTQRAIQAWVAFIDGKPFQPPAIFHSSLIVQNDGHRLEKRTQGVTLSELSPPLSAENITQVFAKSFDRALMKIPFGKLGLAEEAREHVTLTELGF